MDLQKRDKEIIELYKLGHGTPYIEKKLGLGASTAWSALKRNGIKIRSHKQKNINRYQQDDTFFDKIDTPDKAYIYGLIAADGCIQKTRHSSHSIKIDLHSRDKHILEDIAGILQYTGKIYSYKYATGYTLETPINRLLIRSDQMVTALECLGITERKTSTLKDLTTYIDSEFLRDFIRGYFDGDGSWKGMGQDMSWSIVGTKELVEGIAKSLVANKIVYQVTKLQKRRLDCASLQLEYGGSKQMSRIANFMYDDATLFLKRKFNKAKENLDFEYQSKKA